MYQWQFQQKSLNRDHTDLNAMWGGAMHFYEL